MISTARLAGLTPFALGAALLVGSGNGAARPRDPASRTDARASDWRKIASPADRNRLRNWRQSWIDALAHVTTGDGLTVLRADPALFDPDRMLPGAIPPPGAYRCHVLKLGAHGTAMQDFTASAAVDCMVADEGPVSSLYTVSGKQRVVGRIFRDSSSRAVFLGTMVFGDETKPLAYGQDAMRDMAGYIERIGPKRWRAVLPRPRFESMLDVVEITPAPSG